MIVLTVLALLFLLFGALVLMVGGIAVADGKAQEGAPALLEATFTTGEPTVTFATNIIGPQPQDVIEAATSHGYELAGTVPGPYDTATLTFRKAQRH